MRTGRSWKVGIGVIAGVALWATSLLGAQAFHTPWRVGTGVSKYWVSQSFYDFFYGGVANPTVLEASANEWNVQDLYFSASLQRSETVTSNDTAVYAEFLTAQYSNTYALVTRGPAGTNGCPGTTAKCMHFNKNFQCWNTTNEIRSGACGSYAAWIDLRTVATHEFGHVLDISHASINPPTYNWYYQADQTDDHPVMDFTIPPDAKRRHVTQDDVNSIKVAHYGSFINAVANPGFAFVHNGCQPKYLGYYASPQGFIDVCRYGSGGQGDNGAYVQFNGRGTPGASVYQDILMWAQGGRNGEPIAWWNQTANANHWAASVWLRSPLGLPMNVDLKLWRLGDPPGVALAAKSCAISGTAWTLCEAPERPAIDPIAGGNWQVRLQVYNHTSTSLDIDNLSLIWKGVYP